MPFRTVSLRIFYAYLLGTILFFYLIHFFNSNNFPYSDEYRTICKVILDYIHADGFSSKLKVLFVSENESLQLVLKVLNISYYNLFGKIRYDFMAHIGQLCLMIYPILVYKLNIQNKDLWFVLGTTVLIIFNLQYYVLSFRHDTAFYYYVGIFGTLLSIYFWSKKRYTLCAIFFVLGVLNNASSILVIFVFLVDYLLYSQINIKGLIIKFGALLLIVFGLFYIINPNIFYISDSPLLIIKKYFLLMGNFLEVFDIKTFDIYTYTGMAVFASFVTLIIYNFFNSKNQTKQNRFYSLAAIYFFITIAVIAIKRSHLPMIDLLDSRYKFFTFSLLLFSLLLANEIFKFKFYIKVCIVFLLTIYNIFYAFSHLDYIRYLYQGGKLNSVTLSKGYDVLTPTYPNFALQYYISMDSLDIAPKPNQIYSDMVNHLESVELSTQRTGKVDLDIRHERIFEHNHSFHKLSIIGETEGRKRESFVFLKSGDNTYVFPINVYLRNSKVGFLSSLNYTRNSFFCYAYKNFFKKGVYTPGVISIVGPGEYQIFADFKQKIVN